MYGKAFKRLLLSLQQQYLPALKEYIKPESRPSMYDEPQNKLNYLDVDEEDAELIRSGQRPSKEDTGIYDVQFYVTQLEKKIKEQLEM